MDRYVTLLVLNLQQHSMALYMKTDYHTKFENQWKQLFTDQIYSGAHLGIFKGRGAIHKKWHTKAF